MKAPEKIYLQVCGDCTINDKETCEQCYKDNPISNGSEVTWCVDKIFNNDVEYTRTDVFIEKACKWLKENKDKYLYNTGEKGEYIPTCSGKIVDEFRKYMK